LPLFNVLHGLRLQQQAVDQWTKEIARGQCKGHQDTSWLT